MVFNSLVFVGFFFIVVSLFFILPHKYRWLLLLLGSCYFYMAYIPVYILVLLFTIVIDYFAGLLIAKSEGKKRKLFLTTAIVANLAVLSFFKYFNFLNDNFSALLQLFHIANPVPNTSFILPIGLSFHTFQAMSYMIEVYKGRQKAEHKFGIYALYVMFFPQLLAGPIERPQNMIHQFHEQKKFEYDRVVAGLKIMLWGYFKKLVVADRLAIYVNAVYSNPHHHGGLTLFVATMFFAMQQYCDFSGYSDIAIGAAKVMGFNLMENFKRPFLSKNFSGLASRWHISLFSWFRDYVYSPLAIKARKSNFKTFAYIGLVFLLSGLWHGANWTYICWGLALAVFIVIERLIETVVQPRRFINRNVRRVLGTIITVFAIIIIAVFFRSRNMADAMHIMGAIFTFQPGNLFKGSPPINFYYCLIVMAALYITEFFQEYVPQFKIVNNNSIVIRYTGYVLVIMVMLMIGVFNGSQFVYFQF